MPKTNTPKGKSRWYQRPYDHGRGELVPPWPEDVALRRPAEMRAHLVDGYFRASMRYVGGGVELLCRRPGGDGVENYDSRPWPPPGGHLGSGMFRPPENLARPLPPGAKPFRQGPPDNPVPTPNTRRAQVPMRLVTSADHSERPPARAQQAHADLAQPIAGAETGRHHHVRAAHTPHSWWFRVGHEFRIQRSTCGSRHLQHRRGPVIAFSRPLNHQRREHYSMTDPFAGTGALSARGEGHR